MCGIRQSLLVIIFNKYRCWLEHAQAEESIRHAGRDVGIEVIQGAGVSMGVSIGVKSRFRNNRLIVCAEGYSCRACIQSRG